MIKNISVADVVNYLNDLLIIDPIAINGLFSLRISCNAEMRDHPTIQVGTLGKTFGIVGIIGILNGLFGTDKNKWGHISANYDDGKIICFRELSEHQTTEYIKNMS